MPRSNREGPSEINAGSMADIAFLLLIFFLVTTTMDMDEGIMRQLPPPVPEDIDPPDVKQKNVYKVKVNAKDQLLVEGEVMSISQLQKGAMEFYDNPNNSKDLPSRTKVTLAKCNQKIQEAKSALAKDKDNEDAKKVLNKWQDNKRVIEFLGRPYERLPNSALISLRNDRGTSYNMYIQVQNELQAAVNELREDFVKREAAFHAKGVDKYSEIKPNQVDEHKIMELAVRKVYPMRISEAEPLDVEQK